MSQLPILFEYATAQPDLGGHTARAYTRRQIRIGCNTVEQFGVGIQQIGHSPKLASDFMLEKLMLICEAHIDLY